MEPIQEERRIYNSTVSPWFEEPNFWFEESNFYNPYFLDGGAPVAPPSGDRYFNIRTVLEKYYYQETPPRTNVVRHDFFNIPERSIVQVTNHILHIFNIPEENHKSLAQHILHFAENMATNTHRSDNILYMMVVVNCDIFYHNRGISDGNVMTSTNDDNGRQPDRAITASNNKLKGVKVQCQICFKELRVDAVATPCSHLFHGHCIVNWLLNNNNCPVCNFQFHSTH